MQLTGKNGENVVLVITEVYFTQSLQMVMTIVLAYL